MQSQTVNSHSNRPGRLYYVIGASGVGKDTLMDYARERLNQEPVIFAHRYITRPVELKGENHIHLSETEFANRLRLGCFKFHWKSHGWSYALGTEVDTWLNRGLNVVVNGSRGYFEQACSLHPDLIPVLITASPEILRKRLILRGRESEAEIEERIARAAEYAVPKTGSMQVIENETTVNEAGEELVSLFKAAAE